MSVLPQTLLALMLSNFCALSFFATWHIKFPFLLIVMLIRKLVSSKDSNIKNSAKLTE
jgi:hypothetical protein